MNEGRLACFRERKYYSLHGRSDKETEQRQLTGYRSFHTMELRFLACRRCRSRFQHSPLPNRSFSLKPSLRAALLLALILLVCIDSLWLLAPLEALVELSYMTWEPYQHSSMLFSLSMAQALSWPNSCESDRLPERDDNLAGSWEEHMRSTHVLKNCMSASIAQLNGLFGLRRV